jgi:type I restriction enzyme S subunit
MKSTWQTKTLGSVCEFSNGLWKGEKPPFVNVGVIRNTNFTKEGTLDDSDIAYIDVEIKKLEKRRLRFGDIILEKSGGGPKQPVGRVALFDKDEGDFSFSNFTAAIRVINSEELDFRFLHKFLYWTYLSGVTEKIQSNSTGIRNLDGDAYKGIELSFPSLPEQHQIVAILDEAFEGMATARANTEKNLGNARAIFESQLQSVFSQQGAGWVDRQLASLCNEITVGHVGSMKKEYKASGVPFLRSQNIRPFEVTMENVMFIDDRFHGRLKKSQLRPGDLAIVRTGYPGTAAVIPAELPVSNCSDLVIVRPSWEVDPHFLAAFFNSAFGKQLVLGKIVGAAQKHFNITAAKAVMLHVPPMAEQHAIKRMVDTLRRESRRLVSINERKLAALDALKKSLLHRAFAGELTANRTSELVEAVA